MKGMLDFLEKAGLVKKDTPAEPTAPEIDIPHRESTGAARDNTVTVASKQLAPAAGQPLQLDMIYANQGVSPSLYPAERLLRLVDGLSAMDEATRQMAIQAMDAADESWTIDDPLADAAAKVHALTEHSMSLTAQLQQLELQTQAQLDAITSRQEKVVGDIRKQIAELEGLVARELGRSAQETVTQEAELKAARDQVAQDLAEVARVSQRLQGLASQFGASKTNSQE
jgi:hypothetical protein